MSTATNLIEDPVTDAAVKPTAPTAPTAADPSPGQAKFVIGPSLSGPVLAAVMAIIEYSIEMSQNQNKQALVLSTEMMGTMDKDGHLHGGWMTVYQDIIDKGIADGGSLQLDAISNIVNGSVGLGFFGVAIGDRIGTSLKNKSFEQPLKDAAAYRDQLTAEGDGVDKMLARDPAANAANNPTVLNQEETAAVAKRVQELRNGVNIKKVGNSGDPDQDLLDQRAIKQIKEAKDRGDGDFDKALKAANKQVKDIEGQLNSKEQSFDSRVSYYTQGLHTLQNVAPAVTSWKKAENTGNSAKAQANETIDQQTFQGLKGIQEQMLRNVSANQEDAHQYAKNLAQALIAVLAKA